MREERRQHPLTEEQIEELAKKLAPLVRAELEQHFYAFVGRSMVEKFFGYIGLGTIAVMAFLAAKGYLKFPDIQS